MWKMERNTNNILDIHTHKAESVSAGKAIINRKLATDALCEGYFYSAGIHQFAHNWNHNSNFC
jgi:TatD DNase family protein